MATRPSHLAEARAAIAAIGPDFVRLVREGVGDAPSIGRWTVGDVACHVSHAIKVDADALAGHPPPIAELNPEAVAAANDGFLADDPERDLGALADRIEASLADFLEAGTAPVSEQVTWVGGVRIPASAVACHLLEELLVHGFDIASASGSTWAIAPAHAALALVGGAGPIVNAAGPMAFAKPERARAFSARFDVRLRGQQRLTFLFDDGLRVADPTSEPVDAHVSADPVAALLLMLGRIGPARAILGGKFIVWGLRPWRLRRMLAVITPP